MKTKLNDWFKNPNKEAVDFLVHCADTVGRWNLTARGKRDTTMDAIKRQKGFTREEWAGKDEFLQSYVESNKVGALDGLCDMFVTEVEAVFMTLDPGMQVKDYMQEVRYINYLDLSANQVPDLQTICNLLYSFSGDWKGALLEVLASNDSKFEIYDATEVGDYKAWCKTIESQGRYRGVDWKQNNGKVVYMDENKKILKGRHFFEPDLSKYV